MPALTRKAHEARLAGSTAISVLPLREFLHADACVQPLQYCSEDAHVNVGAVEDLAIRTLTEMVCDVIGFTGTIDHDLSKPDATPPKLISANRLGAMGWALQIALRDGIASTYRRFLDGPR